MNSQFSRMRRARRYCPNVRFRLHGSTRREQVRRRFIELIQLSERQSGAPRDLILRHVARSMLGNVALALDLPPEYRPIG